MRSCLRNALMISASPESTRIGAGTRVAIFSSTSSPLINFPKAVYCRSRKRGFYKVILNVIIFGSAKQDSVRAIQRPTGSAYLLIIENHGPGSLIVDYKCEIRLVESHAERNRRHQRFDTIGEQILFPRDAYFFGKARMVGPNGETST